jgi:hypothetical protein
VVPSSHRSIGVDRRVSEPAMTGAARDPGTSANFRYTTSTDMTALSLPLPRFPARTIDSMIGD